MEQVEAVIAAHLDRFRKELENKEAVRMEAVRKVVVEQLDTNPALLNLLKQSSMVTDLAEKVDQTVAQQLR